MKKIHKDMMKWNDYSVDNGGDVDLADEFILSQMQDVGDFLTSDQEDLVRPTVKKSTRRVIK